MSQHAAILDQEEPSLGRPLVGAMVLHISILAALLGLGWVRDRKITQWGVEHPLGGAIGVDVVSKIPLPNRSNVPNLVAHESETTAPQKPDKVEKRPVPKEEPDAVALRQNKDKKPKREVQEVARNLRYRPEPERPNQVYSSAGPAVSSPMYAKQGIHGVGIGESTVAGRGCGGYLELIRQRIQSKWDIQPISSSLQSPLSMMVDIARSGEVHGVAVAQASRNSELDFAAKRTIMDASPFPPFLPTCEGEQAKIEVRFEPKR